MEAIATAPDFAPTSGSQSTKQLSNEELRQEADGLYAGIAYLNQTEQIEDNVVDVDDDDDEEELAECYMVPEVTPSSPLISCTADFETASTGRRYQNSW